MAQDFPSNPVNGQVFANFTYDSSVGVWRNTPDVAGGLPAGSIMAWGGATAPSNWLICDGSAVSRSNYASLFNAIGVQYGSGDGSTTFNLPDLRGRVPVGRNSGTFSTLGSIGGTETVTLTTAQIPSHTHANTLTNATVASSSHTHGSSTMTAAVWVGYWKTRNGTSWTATNSGGVTAPGSNSTSTTSGASIEGSTDGPSATTTVGITNASAGSDGSHNNLQPYQVINFIIKISAGVSSGDSELATRVGAIETTTVRSVALGGTGASTASGALTNLGAAAASHTHDASAITSGSLAVARGGTGSATGAGLVPVVPTAVYVASGSGSVGADGIVTFSGTNYVTFAGAFGSKSRYLVQISGYSGPGTYLGMRGATNGSGNSVAAYYEGGLYRQGATVGIWTNQSGANLMQVGYVPGSEWWQATVEVLNPNNNNACTFINRAFYMGGAGTTVISDGKFNGTSTFDGLQFWCTGGGTFGGTIRILEYRN